MGFVGDGRSAELSGGRDEDNASDESVSACSSKFLPNARLNRFPAMTGESERYPQFSEKWAANRVRQLIRYTQ